MKWLNQSYRKKQMLKMADRFNVVVKQWLDDEIAGELTDEFAGFTLNYASCSSMPDRYEVWSGQGRYAD